MVDSERLAREEQAAEAQVRDTANTPGGYVWMPNAIKLKAKPFIEMRTRMPRKANDLFTNEERTKNMLKKADEGYHYHWARHPQYDPLTAMRVAEGLYQYVQPTEIKADALGMFQSHKGTTGTMVSIGTLVLVKESAEAFRETHLLPQVEAIATLARAEEEFMGGIEEQSKGRAEGTVERVTEQEEIKIPDSE